MDPVTAFSLFCGVLDLVDKGITYGILVRKIYVDGSTVDQEDRKSQVETMDDVVTKLNQEEAKMKNPHNKIDERIASAVAESATQCGILRELLEKCKPKKQASWRSAFMATIRIWRNKPKIEEAQKTLDGCRKQLQILFSVTARLSIGDIKSELERAGAKTSDIAQKLDTLGGSLESGKDDFQQKLNDLRAMFENAQVEIRQTRILEGLAFTDMGMRFDLVRTVQDDAFRWIYHNPNKIRQMEPHLTTNFPDWLTSGSGIFHIVGLPGSGKSTLMKYLFLEKETRRHLQDWAREAGGRELIFCSFFFWSLTQIAELKTLKGLKQGLLYDVLVQSPSLTAHLFPEFWGPTDTIPKGHLPVKLQDSDISGAFDVLMSNPMILEKFRICLFIDGLDEFSHLEGETHSGLAKKLAVWASNPNGHVKMCVTSRPEREFTNIFPESQRITLQNLTKDDIRALVRNRLETNEKFLALKIKSENSERCAKLTAKLVEDAKGVFLWVTLILVQLDRVLNSSGKEGPSIDLLEKTVDLSDDDVEKFFALILNTIPQYYRQGSYSLLAMMLRMSGALISNSRSSEAHRDLERKIVSGMREQQHLTLEDCKLIFDTDNKGKLLDCDDNLANITWDFSQDRKGQELVKEDLVERCRGLAEVSPRLNLEFTHRSIPESLQKVFSRGGLPKDVDVRDEKVEELLTWTVLAESRQWLQKQQKRGGPLRTSSSPRITGILARLRACKQTGEDGKENERTFRLLQSIDRSILSARFGTWEPGDDAWSGDLLCAVRPKPSGKSSIWSILQECRKCRIDEYVNWILDGTGSITGHKSRMLALLSDLIFDIHGNVDEFSAASTHKMIKKLRDCGLSVKRIRSPGHDQNQGHRMWLEFLARELFFKATHHAWSKYYRDEHTSTDFHWRGIQVLLSFGAVIDISLSHGEEREQGVVTGPDGEEYRVSPLDFDYSPSFIPLPRSPISLKEFINFYDKDELLKLN